MTICTKCKEKQASFNIPGEKPRYCSRCKSDDMVDVKSKKCVCGNVRPSFNFPGEKTAEYCSQCKKPDMVNVVSKLCVCGNAQPYFNFPGEKTPEYCSECKKPDMVDVKSKKCICGNTRATFNLPGEKTAKYCSECKSDDMISVSSKLCVCGNVQPSFNFPGKQPEYCSGCKSLDMVNVVSKLCVCGNAQPSFNFPGKQPEYCSECKSVDMIDVKNKRCAANTEQGSICTQVANKNYRNYCTTCFKHFFPDDPLTSKIRCNTQEEKVKKFINDNFDGFVHDKPLWTAHCDCSVRRRIDHRKLFGNTLLCIETDENQHKWYNKQDEKDRYDDLYNAYSGKWIFIRFNPDHYKDQNGKKKNPRMVTRLKALQAEINKQITRIEKEENTELVEIVYMYYDEK